MSHPCFAFHRFELLQRRARHHRVARVTGVQVIEEPVREFLRARRAARATVVPLRVEHEVVDDQLRTPVEHVDEADLPVRAVEHVVLLDLDHGQLASLDVERVACLGHGLFLGQELLAGGQPFVSGGDLRKAHRRSPWIGSARTRRTSSLRRNSAPKLIGLRTSSGSGGRRPARASRSARSLRFRSPRRRPRTRSRAG